MQLEQDQSRELARDLLVQSENAKEHLLRIVIDWPELFGFERSNQQLMYMGNLVASFKQALFHQKDAFSLSSQLKKKISILDPMINELEIYLQDNVYRRSPQNWLDIETIDQLQLWAETSECIPAYSVHQIFQRGWTYQGYSNCQPLPWLDDLSLLKKLSSSEAKTFIAKPAWKGIHYETGSLSRQIDHPLIGFLYREFNNSLITRWSARLVELARIPQQMRNLLQAINQQPACSVPSSPGLAQVEAARGRLIHRVGLGLSRANTEKISNYQIVAPTEWNFHPQGLIAQSLAIIRVKGKQEYNQVARIITNAIDPCVACELSIC